MVHYRKKIGGKVMQIEEQVVDLNLLRRARLINVSKCNDAYKAATTCRDRK